VKWILNISFEELQNFVSKYLLTVKLSIFKYLRQNIISCQSAVALISAITGLKVIFVDRTKSLPTRCVKTVQLLTRETPDFIASTRWPANSSDLSQVDYWIWGSCRSVCTVPDSWRRPAKVAFDRKVVTCQPGNQVVINKAVRQWHTRLQAYTGALGGYFDCKYVRVLHCTVTCLNVVNSGHFMFSGDIVKVAVTYANVDGLYRN